MEHMTPLDLNQFPSLRATGSPLDKFFRDLFRFVAVNGSRFGPSALGWQN